MNSSIHQMLESRIEQNATERQRKGRESRIRIADAYGKKSDRPSSDPAICGGIAAATISGEMASGDLEAVTRTSKRIKHSVATAASIRSGDMSALEDMLVAHSLTLDTAFNELLIRGVSIIEGSTNPKMAQRGISLVEAALKCQKQARQTVMSLNEIRNPKRATFIKNQLNQLIQERHGNDEGMDGATPSIAAGTNSEVEALGEIDRAEDTRGQKACVAECQTV